MARILCKCGTHMWNGETPNDIQFWAYSDRMMDKIREKDTVDVIELSSMENFEIWLCPDCKRLHIFDPNSLSVKCTYKLENS